MRPRLVAHPRMLASRRHAGQSGASLVEVLVGVLVSTAVALAAYTILSNSDKAAVVNDQTAEMQLNARVAMELLTKDLKEAGFGMNGAVGGCSNGVVPADNNTAGADTGPDSVSVIAPTLISTLVNQVNGGAAIVQLQAGAVAAVTPSGFGNGANISLGGVVSNTVNNIAGDTITLGSSLGPSAVLAAGTQVFWLQCVTYAIATDSTTCGGIAPCLTRAGVPLAEGIEDLQIAYACDGCVGTADGVIDDQPGSAAGIDTKDFISDNAWAATPMTPDSIRLARISIVARQTRSDQQWNSTNAVVAEDHNPGTDPGYSQNAYQQIRRRLYTRTVQVRNLGL